MPWFLDLVLPVPFWRRAGGSVAQEGKDFAYGSEKSREGTVHAPLPKCLLLACVLQAPGRDMPCLSS